MSAPYSAVQVANFFIERARAEKAELSKMKLLKLVYIAYGWCWAILDKKLFSDTIEAWKYGPVIPSLYEEIRLINGDVWEPIPERRDFLSAIFDAVKRSHSSENPFDENIKALLQAIWDNYKKYSALELSNMTHRIGTPWYHTYRSSKRWSAIPDSYIQRHYLELLNRNKSSTAQS